MRGRPRKILTPGTQYARDRERMLASVKARQQRLGEAYLAANRKQVAHHRRRRRDRGQPFLPLDIPALPAPALGSAAGWASQLPPAPAP